MGLESDASPDVESLPIQPLSGPITAVVRPPGSKSHTNRALLCAALACGTSTVRGLLFADDTAAMLEVIETLGAGLSVDRTKGIATIAGVAGMVRPATAAPVNVRQSGTTGRFVLPVLGLAPGRTVLDGDPQLRARPFGDLVEALQELGMRMEGTNLPIVVNGGGLRGGEVSVEGAISSQFLSGLLLSAPCAEAEVTINVVGELVSKPYIDLTLDTMQAFGADVAAVGYRQFTVAATGYQAADVTIEPDASAASYFFGAAAMTRGSVTVTGLGTDSVQGDVRFVAALERMGAEVTRTPDSITVVGKHLHGIEIDMSDISDTAQTLAVVATSASSATRISGIGFIRNKETDRLAATVAQLRARGIDAQEEPDGLVVYPGTPSPGTVETYDDHRMAMSFALLGLQHDGIRIADPACVNKTFPEFFDALAGLS